MNIYSELSRIQKELKAPKSQYNSFGKYHYRSCEDILEGVKAVQGDCAVALSDSVEVVGDRIYVRATATLCHPEADAVVVAAAYAREPASKKGMDESQITGAASSYARKYALSALFAIDDNKDADTHQPPQQAKTQPKAQAPNTISEGQLKRLYAIASQAKVSNERAKAIIASYGFESSKDITKDKYETICAAIQGGQ